LPPGSLEKQRIDAAEHCHARPETLKRSIAFMSLARYGRQPAASPADNGNTAMGCASPRSAGGLLKAVEVDTLRPEFGEYSA